MTKDEIKALAKFQRLLDEIEVLASNQDGEDILAIMAWDPQDTAGKANERYSDAAAGRLVTSGDT